MTGPRIGSLCSGYGGLDMAAQEVFGGEVAWVSDIDKGASKILAHRYPTVPNLGDLKTTDWGQVEPVDIVCGGYPCQPFSDAGLRKGTEDERHIWPYIATALRVLRPRVAIFENVAGHLRRGFDAVLADLAELGFDAEWEVVRADAIGAPHIRKRLIILATAADAPNLGHERGREARDWRPGPADGRLVTADTDLDERARESAQQPRRVVVARSGGSAPADAASIGHGHPGPAGIGGVPAAAVSGGLTACEWGAYGPAIARWEHVLGSPAPRPADDRGRLDPLLVEWLMGLPAGHVTSVPGLSRNQQMRALGNGVVPQQAAYALRLLAARASSEVAA